MEVLALIPLRGGSKSIPRKNLLPIDGLPLMAYSIQHALESRLVTRTIVSTEDAEIAAVARQFGAEVPFVRPAEFATDLATDLDVFIHALRALAAEGYHPEVIVQLRATSPVREVAVIDRAVQLMLDDPSADSLKSVSPVDKTPYKMWRVDGSELKPLIEIPGIPEAHSMPRQMLPKAYTGNGYIDIIRPRAILERRSMVGQKVLPFIIEGETFDLDYPAQVPAIARALEAQRVQRGAETYPSKAANG